MMRCLSALALLAVTACREPGCIEVTAAVPLLENPYPLNYPSTAPMPNRTLGTIAAGKHAYIDQTSGKDFMVFELVQSSGARGFVVLDEHVRFCATP
jgi:hypothetical protein